VRAGALFPLVVILSATPADRLSAQGMQIGAQGVFGDYKETAAALHYQGGGIAAWVSLARGKMSGDFSFTGLTYKPADDGVAVEEFKTVQLDGRLRYYIASGVHAEVGFTRRVADPEFAAQSSSAARFGLRASYVLGPGANLSVRGNYLAGGRFSGGGEAAFGLEVGLGLSVGALNGRWRITADYEFQRFNRTTTSGLGEAKVPLQQALARVGAALGF
jgi:hypothetical protein